MGPKDGIIVLLLSLAACGTAYGLSRSLCDPASLWYVLDWPNKRSLHSKPTPRGGGLAILIALAMVWLPTWFFWPVPAGLYWIVAGVVLLAVVALYDDRRDLPQWVRLVAHGIAAIFVVAGGIVPESVNLPFLEGSLSEGWSAVLVWLFIVWFVNLYNFMDGMDGFAGGMGLFGFGVMGVLGWRADAPSFVTACGIVAAANLGFLFRNFPPAKIFMGDVGSTTMGFLAASFALWGALDGLFPLWVPLIVFSPFWVDATVTLFRRLFHGEKVWQAHRSHYYQRLVQIGWGHKRTLLWEYVLMAACSLSVFLARSFNAKVEWIMVYMWVFVYFAIVWAVTRLEGKRRSS